MVIDTVQTFFNARKHRKIGIVARCTYIVNKKDEPASENFVKNYAKVSATKQERSKNVSALKAKNTEKKPRRKRCNTCIHFKYGVNPKNKRAGYYCEVTMRYARSYLQLKECKAPQYKHK